MCLGVVGGGGSIRDVEGNNVDHYTWGLRNVSNNLVEAHLLWKVLSIAKNQGI